ncbi:hypothetical protein HMPREF9123_2778 [Neisseria bacilliformis ATCC BAA-1200]|uniref:Uncharacterized protein n=1 Tax=Neisseria bacilliformis ATCC BAA-1200 TaxID=888742 RepID=F2BGC1_9NEIS|nr:hypothetical protein HMPREF9123_2778 [Neisseria bacilliformis ATCC BAA-1200]
MCRHEATHAVFIAQRPSEKCKPVFQTAYRFPTPNAAVRSNRVRGLRHTPYLRAEAV